MIDDFAYNLSLLFFFFFNDTATTEIYTLSLHDALPISPRPPRRSPTSTESARSTRSPGDRKSTRLNSSHRTISYAVFCLKKKKQPHRLQHRKHRHTSADPQKEARPNT